MFRDGLWIHLDLKGAVPSAEYLKELIAYLARRGGGGVRGFLLEYEDSFPYRSFQFEGEDISSRFSESELRSLCSVIKKSGFEIVPLVQTVGHLEFLLKSERYVHLRENPIFPDTICPSAIPDSRNLLVRLLDEVLTFHGNEISAFHLGGDEAWQLGRIGSRTPVDEVESFYLQHIGYLAEYLVNKGLRVLMWDDMIRKIPVDVTRQILCKGNSRRSLVEPVVWNYTPDLQFPDDIWNNYKQLFGDGIWCASAFKGATSSRAQMPNSSYHMENHVSWLNLIKAKQIPVSGFILTGWQRFDHFATLCELLPVSIPSLLLCLNVMDHQHGDEKDDFPGSSLFLIMKRFVEELKPTYETLVHGDVIGTWFNDYLVKTHRVSKLQAQYVFPQIQNLLQSLIEFQNDHFRSECFKYFHRPNYVFQEWTETHTEPMIKELTRLSKIGNDILAEK